MNKWLIIVLIFLFNCRGDNTRQIVKLSQEDQVKILEKHNSDIKIYEGTETYNKILNDSNIFTISKEHPPLNDLNPEEEIDSINFIRLDDELIIINYQFTVGKCFDYLSYYQDQSDTILIKTAYVTEGGVEIDELGDTLIWGTGCECACLVLIETHFNIRDEFKNKTIKYKNQIIEI